MREPVDHILRPQLPWRTDPGITECGYDATKVTTITRDDYFARRKDLGQQRCAMLTCMTCAQTAERWGTWADDPRRALGREIEWEAGSYYRRTDRGERLKDELEAIAMLVADHKDAFDAIIAARVSRREWLQKKAEHQAPKAPAPRRGL